MTHAYKELGLRIGLECHQQLEGKKLFCNCPTEIRKEKADFEIIRRLKPSAGETGRIDQAALHEQKKQKYFIYQGYNDINCGVEIDEEPPTPVNTDSLRAALQIAKALNCKIVDKIQVMRKTVVDGSNVSGFQRTMLIGLNGFVEVDGKKYGIETVCLEEEACQVIERKKEYDVYNLSRLGIPLIEIATAADMHTPEEAKEVAGKLGMILRSIPECKRGIGSIRQDVNLSIKGGVRVEVKGFQELKSIPKVIDFEIDRHIKLLAKGETMIEEVRKAEEDFTTTFLRPMPGTDRMYPETDIPEITPNLNISSVKTLDERQKELQTKFKLSEDLAKKALSHESYFIKTADEFTKLKPQFIAETLFVSPGIISQETKMTFDIFKHEHETKEMFHQMNASNISTSSVLPILKEVADGKKIDFSKYSSMSKETLESEIIELFKLNPSATSGFIMGQLNKKHPGKIDGKIAMELLNKHKLSQ